MDIINPNYLKASKFQNKISTNSIQCLTCERKCKLSQEKLGYCQTRKNIGGKVYSIVYGCIPALSFNPIEKKPLFHFYPGTTAITIGTYSCNFSCFWCQNHHLSHPSKLIESKINEVKEYLSPESLIDMALENHCQGTSISFNEPTLLFEYSLDAFKLAKKKGLYNTYVSNGYMTEEVLKELIKKGLDAINIDIKGDAEMVRKYCGTDVEKVWRNAKLAKELGIHVEITTLLITKLNSEKEIIKGIAERILKELGEFTPYHITRFFPHYEANKYGYFKPSSGELLENAYKIAKHVGLKYVYLGNLANAKYEHTTCPQCSKIVIKRIIFGIKELNLDGNGNCNFCGFPICKQ